MKYRALFTDFDGTLYAGGGKVSDVNRKAIKAAKEAGKLVIICSGRSWKSLAHYEEMLGLDGSGNYGVAFNGGVVYVNTENTEIGKEFLCRHTMDTSLAHDIIRHLKKLTPEFPGTDVLVYGDNDELYAGEHLRGVTNFGENRYLHTYFVPDFLEFPIGFAKIIVFGEDKNVKELARRIPIKCDMFFSASGFMEIMPPNVNKGRGMMFLADYLGIPPQEIIAMGDAGNDVDMLKQAGLGIAVANASDEAKAAADLILKESCDEDAVSIVINNYLLQGTVKK